MTVNSLHRSGGQQGTGGSDSAAIDTEATGAPTVVITEDVNNDGTISNTGSAARWTWQ